MIPFPVSRIREAQLTCRETLVSMVLLESRSNTLCEALQYLREFIPKPPYQSKNDRLPSVRFYLSLR